MSFRALSGRMAVLACLTVVGGCSHMPVTSMIKLAQIDFETTDPEKLRAAVKLPRPLKARPEGTVLRIAVKLASGEEESRDLSCRPRMRWERLPPRATLDPNCSPSR